MCGTALALIPSFKVEACPGLQGTFLQLTDAQAGRPPSDWRQLIDQMRTVGIHDLFLQWTIVDHEAFFPTAKFTTPVNTPLPFIMRLASQSGMRVWVGLALDSAYWEEIKEPPNLLRFYFQRRLRELREFLGDLNTAIGKTSFAGWYIPDEIDDRTWLDPEKHAILLRYLLSRALVGQSL